jgi:hypothetical protein
MVLSSRGPRGVRWPIARNQPSLPPEPPHRHAAVTTRPFGNEQSPPVIGMRLPSPRVRALRVKITPALRCVVAVPRSDRSANADTIAAAHFNTKEGAS